jgi:hypothetical protein
MRRWRQFERLLACAAQGDFNRRVGGGFIGKEFGVHSFGPDFVLHGASDLAAFGSEKRAYSRKIVSILLPIRVESAANPLPKKVVFLSAFTRHDALRCRIAIGRKPCIYAALRLLQSKIEHLSKTRISLTKNIRSGGESHLYQ